jgi:hypothetical protein
MRAEFAQIPVVPRRLNTFVDGWILIFIVPANAEAITIRCLSPELRVEALVDERMSGFVQQVL